MFTVIIVVCSLKSTKFHLNCVSELHGHICPYCNVWPEAVYCCFTKLHCLSNCIHVYMSELEVAITSIHYGSEIATNVNTLPEVIYCCFTRSTLFTDIFLCSEL